jgi:hypothetical protein
MLNYLCIIMLMILLITRVFIQFDVRRNAKYYNGGDK